MYFLSSTVPIKDNISASTDEESGIGSSKRSPRRDCMYITIVVILTTALIGLVVYVLGKFIVWFPPLDLVEETRLRTHITTSYIPMRGSRKSCQGGGGQFGNVF